uniref:Uncharacterized protein n=1 Tax=Knipowitschia caucasica TaxID=637954 RepID=A0AAV2LI71_KNICA
MSPSHDPSVPVDSLEVAHVYECPPQTSSLGSADRKENHHKKSESGISKFTHRLSLKERPYKAEKNRDRPASYRRRSLSVDW